jgi:hypothetical protein
MSSDYDVAVLSKRSGDAATPAGQASTPGARMAGSNRRGRLIPHPDLLSLRAGAT